MERFKLMERFADQGGAALAVVIREQDVTEMEQLLQFKLECLKDCLLKYRMLNDSLFQIALFVNHQGDCQHVWIAALPKMVPYRFHER